MSKLIVITGPDGSGKSTVVAILENLLKPKASIVNIWEGLSEWPLGISREGVTEYLKTNNALSRSLLILHRISQSLHEARFAPVTLIDGYWYKYAATETALCHQTPMDEIAQQIFPKPQTTFFLNVSPASAVKRKRTITPYEAGFALEHGMEHQFIRFQERTHRVWLELVKRNPSWHCIDTESQTAEQIANSIYKKLLDEQFLQIPGKA